MTFFAAVITLTSIYLERNPISRRYNGVLSILVQCAIRGAEEFSYSGIQLDAGPWSMKCRIGTCLANSCIAP